MFLYNVKLFKKIMINNNELLINYVLTLKKHLTTYISLYLHNKMR